MSDDTTDYVNTIRRSNDEISILKQKLKDKKEMLASYIEQTDEWLEWQPKVNEAKIAKAVLDRKLLGDGIYNEQMEAIANTKEELKDKKDILSTFIVSYHTETKETQVEIGDNGDAYNLVISGKLGKKTKYQTNIFNQEKQ